MSEQRDRNEITRLMVQVAALEAERDAAREELESNRACNLYTWKERAQAAESLLATVAQALEGKAHGWRRWADQSAGHADDPKTLTADGYSSGIDVMRQFADDLAAVRALIRDGK